MKKYTSCFIGIPLPEKYQQEFEALLADISEIYPLVEVVYPKTPHITGYYLDEQSQFNLLNITKKVQSVIGLLRGSEITVGGLGHFGGDDPMVLFLNVLYPKALKDFNLSITKSLADYYAKGNNLPFHPHMTIGRINTLEAQKTFKESVSRLKTRLSKTVWKFPITEVILYGVDSAKHPQHQERLISVSID